MGKDMNYGMAVFFSFIGGALLGAGAAILLAPESGEKTRKRIRQYSEKIADEIKDRVEDMNTKAKKYVDEAKEKIAGVAEKMQ